MRRREGEDEGPMRRREGDMERMGDGEGVERGDGDLIETETKTERGETDGKVNRERGMRRGVR